MAEWVERRLITILAADVAEYSRLTRADEDGTLHTLTACRAVVDALTTDHRGRIANTAGDSVLAEFPSIVGGLSCALAIQQSLAKHNEGQPTDRRMLFCMGLHIGDVLIKDGDLFGDAVPAPSVGAPRFRESIWPSEDDAIAVIVRYLRRWGLIRQALVPNKRRTEADARPS